MQATTPTRLGRDLVELFGRGTAPPGDAALLARFLDEGDHAAFERLVRRHGPMVRGVCRRCLPADQDVDDAFQATFLVLVQKARRLRDADRLGPWLHGVAHRVAVKARARELRRRQRLGPATADGPACAAPSLDRLDLGPILDAELARISPRLREVLILCLLDGATADEAARLLGCPLGTVKSRLDRGRKALRARLARRGVVPAVVVTATAASSSFTSSVSASLIQATTQGLLGRPAELAPAVVALARGVTPMMLTWKSTATLGVLLGVVGLAGLGTVGGFRPLVHAQNPPPTATTPTPRAGAPLGDREARINRVLDESQARAQSINHLKLILLAFHNYHSVTDAFPPAAIYGSDGQPKLSWRVALLPFFDQNDLYQRFRLDEPWDSPHNRELLSQMPEVYTTPEAPTPAGQTRFRGFQGAGALFESVLGIKVSQITDGTSNTVAVVSAEDPVEWTRPGELPFGKGELQVSLIRDTVGRVLLGMGDGSVRQAKRPSPPFLRALITRNGGEVIAADALTDPERDDLAFPLGPPSPPNPSSLAPTPPIPPTPPAPPTALLPPNLPYQTLVEIAATPPPAAPPSAAEPAGVVGPRGGMMRSKSMSGMREYQAAGTHTTVQPPTDAQFHYLPAAPAAPTPPPTPPVAPARPGAAGNGMAGAATAPGFQGETIGLGYQRVDPNLTPGEAMLAARIRLIEDKLDRLIQQLRAVPSPNGALGP